MPVASLLAVADHHRHHSLDLEQVEARVVKIAEVAAHAMYFRFPLFLYHQQVMELEAILVGVQADLAVQESRRFGRSPRPNHERR